MFKMHKMRILPIIGILLIPASAFAQSAEVKVQLNVITDPAVLGVTEQAIEEGAEPGTVIWQTRNCCRFARYRPADAPDYCLAPDMAHRVEATPACENLP